MTHRAAFLDYLPSSVALPASAPDGEKTLLIENFAASAASGTNRGPGSRLGALTFAMLARLETRRLDVHRLAEDGILEFDLQVVAQVLAAMRSIPTPAA